MGTLGFTVSFSPHLLLHHAFSVGCPSLPRPDGWFWPCRRRRAPISSTQTPHVLVDPHADINNDGVPDAYDRNLDGKPEVGLVHPGLVQPGFGLGIHGLGLHGLVHPVKTLKANP